MAEHISDNMRFSDDIHAVAEKIADHIKRFWDPRMRDALCEVEGEQKAALSIELQTALDKLADLSAAQDPRSSTQTDDSV